MIEMAPPRAYPNEILAMIRTKLWLVLALVIALSLAGCKGEEDVRTYTVEREPEKALPAKGEQPPVGDAKYRFLGAILPAGERSFWFVRFFGPSQQVSPHEADFDKFLASIRVADGGRNLTWTVPTGWKLGPAKQMRMVTLIKDAAEFYVSDPISGTILENVNRWRTDFTGIAKVTEAELPSVTTEIVLGTTKAYRVDFRGPGGPSAGGGMRGPFQGK